MEIDYNKIAKKLEDLIKKQIKADGLVKSGKLYDSISVTPKPKGAGFNLTAEDYFVYLNKEHKIMDKVTKSKEFTEFYAKTVAESVEKDLKKI